MEIEFEKWECEYAPDELQDDDLMLNLKTAVGKLNTIQRKIFLTYAELGSYAATGREFGVSTPTAKKYINEIKDKIFNNL